MRIVIDIQGCQSEGSRSRGIGRYSLNLIKNLIHYFPDNEYILFANSSLYDLRSEFLDELSSNDLKVTYFQFYSILPTSGEFSNNNARVEFARSIRSYSLCKLNPNIVLITSIFEGFVDNCVTTFSDIFKLPPITCIVYDLIPLLNKETYLETNPSFDYFYRKKLTDLEKLDFLFAISDSACEEVVAELNVNKNNVISISSACDQSIFKTSNVKSINKLIKNDKYILYTGAGDPRKNLYRLVEAYSYLPSNLISQYKLVLAGSLIPEEIDLIYKTALNWNLPKEYIIILGYVSDEDLIDLYKGCSLFVFPSLHEGFGLPVLEAMNCGAVVIGSNVSSIPEIINNPKALFDPYDVFSMRDLIEKCLTDQDLIEELKSFNELQKDKFSWKNTVEILHQKLKEISDINSHKNNKSSSTKSIEKLILSQINKFKDESSSDVFHNHLKYAMSCLSLVRIQLNQYICSDRLSNPNNWQIEGPFDSSYSLSILNKNYALALSNLGQQVYLVSAEGPGEFEPDQNFLSKNSEIKEIYDKEKDLVSLDIQSRNMYPPRVGDMCGEIKLLHAYGWEESIFPDRWVNEFNCNLTGISVMSTQVKKVLIDNGIRLPIRVTPLGLDHLEDIEPSDFEITNNNFKFLHVSSCFPRKGISVLIEAFGRAFTKKDRVSLIIKTFDNPHNQIKSLVSEAKDRFPSYPDIKVILNDLNGADIKKLYCISDCYVSPSFGEGFCLPIGEAMKTGLPIITCGHGGQMEFCNEENSWLIDYDFEYTKNHFNLLSSVWAVPKTDHLSSIMRSLYDGKFNINSKIEKAKASINDLTWENLAKNNIEFKNDLLESRRYKYNQPRIGIITSWNTKCGIASYSRNLFDKFQSQFCILANYEKSVNDTNDNLILRCWNMGDDDFAEIMNNIYERRLSTIIIQFNFGMYDFKKLSAFIRRLKKESIHVLILLHSTINPIGREDKRLDLLYDALNLCDRLMVHSVHDLNRLKHLNLVDNVLLFPHAINSVDNTIDLKNLHHSKIKTVSSFGFCLPNKGLKELVQAIGYLKDKGMNMNVNLLCSEYSSDYKYYVDDVHNLINDQGLSDSVNFNSDYLDIDYIMKVLSSSDLIVYPYQTSSESSSAAVRHGLASGSPVMVTPLEVFDDVSPLVFKSSGCSSYDIAHSISGFFNHKNINREWIKKTKLLQEAIKTHNIQKLSYQLENLVNSIEINHQFDM